MSLFQDQDLLSDIEKNLKEITEIIQLQPIVSEEFESGTIPGSVLRTSQLSFSQLLKKKMQENISPLQLQDYIRQLQQKYSSLNPEIALPNTITSENLLEFFPIIPENSDDAKEYMRVRESLQKSLETLHENRQRYQFYKENDKLYSQIIDDKLTTRASLDTLISETEMILDEIIEKVDSNSIPNKTTIEKKRNTDSSICQNYINKRFQ
ncbi:hypothetical protein WA158_002343 [Blastocystis sp. Blastoise]